jgi:hypothetical protein
VDDGETGDLARRNEAGFGLYRGIRDDRDGADRLASREAALARATVRRAPRQGVGYGIFDPLPPADRTPHLSRRHAATTGQLDLAADTRENDVVSRHGSVLRPTARLVDLYQTFM